MKKYPPRANRAAIVPVLLGLLPFVSSTPASAQNTQQTHDVVIPAGTLGAALARLGRELGVVVTVDASLVRGRSTEGLSGRFTPDAAFATLLAGSGLQAEQDGKGGYRLIPTAPRAQAQSQSTAAPAPERAVAEKSAGQVANIETVIVTGEKLPDEYAGGQIARGSRLGLLGNRDVLDTPFSTTSYTAQMMKNIEARSLAQVIAADPSVHFAGSTSRTYDGFEIRGFAFQSQSVMFDGLYGVAPPLQVAVETVERVELIKGPSALLGGMSPTGAVGGTVNLAPKRAGATPNLQITGSYYSDSELGGHVDMGRRFGVDQEIGVRVNAVYRDGDLALHGNSRETVDAAIGVDFVRGGFRVTGDLGYQERDIRGVDADHYLAGGVTVLPEAPDADDAHFQPWSSQKTEATYGVLRAEYEFNPRAMAYAAAGFGESEARLVASFAFPLQQSGDFSENYWGDAQDYDSVSTEVGFRGLVNTGPVEHQLAIAGMKADREDGVVNIFDSSIVGGLPPTPSNLYSPNFLPAPAALGIFPTIPKTKDTVLTSFALADTLSFDDGRALITVGARRQTVEVRSFNPAGAVTSSYDESATSPAAGFVFKARRNISLYGNYGEGLSQGPTAPGAAVNAGEVFPPYKTKQIEAGVKLDHGSFMSTVALFQIEQPSGLTHPQTRIFSVDGERRHRGIELNTFGSPLNGLRLLGGVTLMDAELTRTQDGLNDGRTPPSISKVRASLGGEWDATFVEGLTFTARGVYASSFYVDTANRIEAPSYTTLDLGARYSTLAAGKPLAVRLNVENVFNKAYWNGFDLVRGAPRTVLLSGTVAF